MSEKEKKLVSEFLLGQEWQFLGKDPGLKATDLFLFSKKYLTQVEVPSAVSLGASFFDEFLALNNFNLEKTNEEDTKNGRLPERFEEINKKLLNCLPYQEPVAFRSSAREERGGIGIFRSRFFIKGFNEPQNLRLIEEVERDIYVSSFSAKAKAFRRKNPNLPAGMGILIQPVVADLLEIEGKPCYLPVLSGVIYPENKEPSLKIVIGLGTRAVNSEEGIVLKGKEIYTDKLYKELNLLRLADVINNKGEVVTIEINHELRNLSYEMVGNIGQILNEWVNLSFTAKENYYWEFAISKDADCPRAVIQASRIDQKPEVLIEMEPPEGKILCDGRDVLNTGRKKGRGIIFLNYDYNEDDLERLSFFNQNNLNYLLIVPQAVLSGIQGLIDLNFSHFSNASGIVELQTNPKESWTPSHSGKGATHFGRLCNQSNILFLGTTDDNLSPNFSEKLGNLSELISPDLKFYDADFIFTNTLEQGRVEILKIHHRERKYQQRELREWADQIRDLANSFADSGDEELRKRAESLYYSDDLFLHAFEPKPLTEFDPFAGVYEIPVAEIPQYIQYINTTINNLNWLDDYELHQRYDEPYHLEEFFKEALQILEKRLQNS